MLLCPLGTADIISVDGACSEAIIPRKCATTWFRLHVEFEAIVWATIVCRIEEVGRWSLFFWVPVMQVCCSHLYFYSELSYK